MTAGAWMADYAPQPRNTGSGRLGVPVTLLGARLRDMRMESGRTQKQMAVALSTSGSRVSDWEMGIHQPTLTLLQRYARAFDTSVSQLLDGVL